MIIFLSSRNIKSLLHKIHLIVCNKLNLCSKLSNMPVKTNGEVSVGEMAFYDLFSSKIKVTKGCSFTVELTPLLVFISGLGMTIQSITDQLDNQKRILESKSFVLSQHILVNYNFTINSSSI